jgi:hypothetical protein
MRLRFVPLALCLCLFAGASARAQEPSTKTDSDLTRPILYSIRPEYFRVDDGVWRMQVVSRYDTAIRRNRIWLGGKRGMLIRLELPVVTSEAPSAGTQTGLGDAYAQVLSIPFNNGRFAYVVGTGLFLPTATDRILGAGKVTLAPAFAPIWFLRGRGMFYVKLQDFISVAGADDRPDASFFLVTPTLMHTLPRRSWILLDTETTTNWHQGGKTGVKSGVQFGKIARGFGLWLKPEVWWGPNRAGRWNLKTGLVIYR